MARSVLLAVLLVLCAPVFGQQMLYGINSRTMLAMMPDVKKELKITKEQDKQIQALLQELQNLGLGGFSVSNPMGALDPKLESILTDAQKPRMEELFVQANGGFALTDPKVAAAMTLTDEQTAQVKTIDEEANEVCQELMLKARSNSGIKELKAKYKEYGEKIKALLTPEQATKFAALQGKPFKFKG